MDELIVSYINTAYSIEVQTLLFKCFDTYNQFNYTNVEEDFIEKIMNSSYMTSEDLHDSILTLASEKLDFIIREHKITLDDDTTLSNKLEFCQGLYRLQFMEDYTGIINALESLEPNDEILTLIMSDVTSLTEIEIREMIKEFNPIVLASLKSYIYDKEKENVREENTSLINQIKHFFIFFDKPSIGRELSSVVLLGQRFDQYLPFVKDELLIGNNETIAFNIYSVLMLSIDGYNNPIIIYRKYSNEFFHDINTISLIEEFILKFSNQFQEYMKAQDEKNRLS